MLVGSARHVVYAFLLFGWTLSAWAVDSLPKAKQTPGRPVAPVVASEPTSRAAVAAGSNDPAELRAEVEKGLKELSQAVEKELTPTQKSLRDIWIKRVDLLDEWERAAKGRQSIENPNPSPERETADRKVEWERARTQLELVARSPEAILPELFKISADKVDDAKLLEMREAIDAAKNVLNEKTIESEKLRAEPLARTTSLTASRAARDKIHTEITELPTLRLQSESAVFKAPNEGARKIAREEFINLKCKSGLAAERLRMTEANIALEVRRAVTCEAATQAAQANVALASVTLAALTDRYKGITERQKATLTRAAKTEEKRAETADDPLEKFKAHRTAELLSLQALNLEDNKALSTSPHLSLEEQKNLADRAEADFASLKQMVKENKLGGLVALRLNNDFRRISRERAFLVRTELAQSSAATTFYENALTEAELSYFNDARDDRYERDAFIQTLPRSRHAIANAMIDELEKKHKDLLEKRKDVLGKLLARAEATHIQVTRRLNILDQQYAFTRTTIFWVRDAEPLGPTTIVQARKETGRLLASMGRLAAEPFDRSEWTPVSVEFATALAGMIAFPWIIIQARKSLKAMLS